MSVQTTYYANLPDQSLSFCEGQMISDSQDWALQFASFVQQNFIIEIICLTGQILATIISLRFIWQHRQKYPLKQNTPILTIMIILSFLICNIIMLTCRMIIQWNLSSQATQDKQRISFFQQECCFWRYNWIKQLNYIHLFFSELIIPAICLKMLRVSIAYYNIQKQWLINMFSKNSTIIVMVLSWTSFWMVSEIVITQAFLSKHQDYSISQYGGLQYYQFFCTKYPDRFPNSSYYFVWQLVKSSLSSLIYVVQYFFSDKIDQNYSFKSQYNSQLLVYLLPLISRSILDAKYISNLYSWYHVEFFMYYISTLTIAYYQRKCYQLEHKAHPNLTHDQQDIEDYYDMPMKQFRMKGFRRFFYLYLSQMKRSQIIIFIEEIDQMLITVSKNESKQSAIFIQDPQMGLLKQNYQYVYRIKQFINNFKQEYFKCLDEKNGQDVERRKKYQALEELCDKNIEQAHTQKKNLEELFQMKNQFNASNIYTTGTQQENKLVTNINQSKTKFYILINQITSKTRTYHNAFVHDQLKRLKQEHYNYYKNYVQMVRDRIQTENVLFRLGIQLNR